MTVAPNRLRAGDRVEFNTERGRHSGRIKWFLKCIGNGQQHAVIELDADVEGLLENVPVIDLKPKTNLS